MKSTSPIATIVLLFILNCLSNCVSAQCLVSLDHTPIIVNDLKAAEQRFQDLGFVIKPGYLHENGILNSHIKFQNHTSIELMSITEAKDAIARSYLPFLEAGEGGSFLSLRIDSIQPVLERLETANIEFEFLDGKSFQYIVFDEPGLNHIFLIAYKRDFLQQKKYLQHAMNTSGLDEVSLEGSKITSRLFEALGCSTVHREEIHHRFQLQNGFVNIHKAPTGRLYRVVGIALENAARDRKTEVVHGLSISY